MFEANGWTKFSEEDTYENGCKGRSTCFTDKVMRFSGHSINDIISALMEFTGAENRDCVLLDACDEDGRIDIQVHENAEGYPASKRDIENWKEGKCRLWLSDYIFRVEQVERKSPRLSA